jgi:hypothetical protein
MTWRSTVRVDTPLKKATWINALSACSERFLSTMKKVT